MTIKETFKLVLGFVIIITVMFGAVIGLFLYAGEDLTMSIVYGYLGAIAFVVFFIPLIIGVAELLDL